MIETSPTIQAPISPEKAANDNAVVRVENVYKSFGNRTVLKGLSLNIERGKNTVILGPSGTGKSVLLKHVVGLLKPDKGKVYFEDQCLCELSARKLIEARKRIGFMFQMAALFDSMTVGDNVAFPLVEHTRLSREQRQEKVHAALSMVGMEHTIHQMPGQLSGGQRKRIALARAIILQPEMILYDEPTAGLDPIRAGVISELIAELSRIMGVTSIVVTHDMSSASRIADRIVLLHGTKIVCDGSPEQVMNSKEKYVQDFIQGRPSEEDLESIQGVLARSSKPADKL